MFGRVQKSPTITIEQLIEFTNADNRSRQHIAYRCMNPASRITQNPGEAQYYICEYLNGAISQSDLASVRRRLESASGANPNDRRRNQFNSYCIDRFLDSYCGDLLPKNASVAHSETEPIYVSGIKIVADIPLRLSVPSNSETDDGGGVCFRFDPVPLLTNQAEWIASLVYGYLNQVCADESLKIKRGRCCLYDVADGRAYRAPRNALKRYKTAIKACNDLVECWQSMASPRSFHRSTSRFFAGENSFTKTTQRFETANKPAGAVPHH